jgi:hypothetical protein
VRGAIQCSISQTAEQRVNLMNFIIESGKNYRGQLESISKQAVFVSNDGRATDYRRYKLVSDNNVHKCLLLSELTNFIRSAKSTIGSDYCDP